MQIQQHLNSMPPLAYAKAVPGKQYRGVGRIGKIPNGGAEIKKPTFDPSAGRDYEQDADVNDD
jgi:hypothetical protein